MLELRLHPGTAGARRLRLRPLEGRDELQWQPSGPEGFRVLLEGLLVQATEDFIAPSQARDLAVCDLEAVAAALHQRYYGSLIECHAHCSQCDRDFELSFNLEKMLSSIQDSHSNGISGPDDQGVFTLEDGRQFRLPTGADEEAVALLAQDEAARELQRRCVVRGSFANDPEVLDAALEATGPLLPQELEAHCPHCGAAQMVYFHLRRFFLDALATERRFLNAEVHHLARGYGWSRAEILGLTREDRRGHVQMVLPHINPSF